MKTMTAPLPTHDDINRFYNEYEILKALPPHPHIRRVYARAKIKNKHTIFLEYAEGDSLCSYGKFSSLANFLSIARQITEALQFVHSHRIVHKDVNARNVVMTRDTKEIKLIDFGISATVRRGSSCLDPYVQRDGSVRLEGSLQYISPEQLDKLGRGIDYRSDLYSLGCVFYLMLSGSLPFETIYPKVLMSNHANDNPVPLAERGVPVIFSHIVAKLMKKNPDERYQSACCLLHDLQELSDRYDDCGDYPEFELGRTGRLGRFCLPSKIYGRGAETHLLREAFSRVRDGRRSKEVVIVTGVSGVGKSALVSDSLKGFVERSGGLFLSGKFDQMETSGPYDALRQAFDGLISFVVRHYTPEKLETWRKTLLKVVGSEGYVLTSVIPSLKSLIGENPQKCQILSSKDTSSNRVINVQDRFTFLFCEFVKTLSTLLNKCPIVLFIDDLQWGCNATVSLLSSLMKDEGLTNWLIIAAYRLCDDNNFGISLIPIISEMKEKGRVDVTCVQIGEMTVDDVNDMLSEALRFAPDKDRTRRLTQLVHKKTLGNAFFTTQFLKSLSDDASSQLLYFCFQDMRWKWDLNKIEQMEVTDNVVDLLVKTVQKLDEELKEALKVASCLGNQFDSDTLQMIMEEDVTSLLDQAVSKGMIIRTPQSKTYTFSHDRIQQAIYSTIPTIKRDALHHTIGKKLNHKLLKKRKRKDMIFVVVNQMNSGITQITQEEERLELAKLNLLAGRGALNSSAFHPALRCITTGINLLTGDDSGDSSSNVLTTAQRDPSFHWCPKWWIDDYMLSLELHVSAAVLDCAIGNWAHMTDMIRTVYDNAKCVQDKLDCYSIQMRAFRAQNNYEEVIETGLQALEQMGERFPPDPDRFTITISLLRTKFLLWSKSNDDILALPISEDPKIIGTMRIMYEMLATTFLTRLSLAPLLICRIIQLTLAHGITTFSMSGFSWYAAKLCGLGYVDEGFRLGQLVLKLCEQRLSHTNEMLPVVYALFYGAICISRHTIHDTYETLLRGYRIGMEVGDTGRAMICASRYVVALYFGGNTPLFKVEEQASFFHKQCLAYRQDHIIYQVAPLLQVVYNLRGKGMQSDDHSVLKGDAFDEDAVASLDLKTNFAEIAMIYGYRMILAYMFHDYMKASESADNSRNYLKKAAGFCETLWSRFYDVLVSCAVVRCRTSCKDPSFRKKKLASAQELLTRYRLMAKEAPDNFENKLYLIEAEWAFTTTMGTKRNKNDSADRLRNEEAILDLYNNSIQRAETCKFLSEEALACERAGIFCVETGRVEMAAPFLKRACQVYLHWGAKAKVKQIEKLYEHLLCFDERLKKKRVCY